MLYLTLFSRLTRIVLLLLSCLLLTVVAVAQEKPVKPEQQPREKVEDQEGTIRIDTDLVSVDVAVTSRSGAPPNRLLKVEDFTIYEDGVRQQISSFSATEVPFNLVLLIDTSGSTQDQLDLIQRAALRFLDELRPQDRVAVMSFHKEVDLLTDLTSDRAKLEEAINRLPTGTGGAFYDALELAIGDVLKKVEGRKAIITMTDGVDSFSNSAFEEILPEIEKEGASLYFLEVDTEAYTEEGMMMDCYNDLHFEFSPRQLKKYYAGAKPRGIHFTNHCLIPREDRQRINHYLYEAARRELRVMADKTGGKVYPVKTLRQLEPTYASIAAELRTQYSIAYYPTNDKRDGSWRKLRVEVKAAGLIARTRPGYRARRD